MSDEILKRDQNFVTVLGGVTNDADQEIKMLRVDPITGRLLVNASGGSGGVTSFNGLTGAVTISAGTNITLTILGNDIEIASSGSSSPLTTKGDLYTFTNVNARLPVGTNGYLLSADSVETTGLKWIPAPATGLTIGTTTITSGTTTRILYDNAGVLGEYTLTGSGTVVAMQTSPTFITNIIVPVVRADTSAGVILEANNGTDIGLLGAGNTANVTWYGSHNFDTATQDTIAAFTGAGKTLGSLALATYPSLTELSYVKGVTSAIQTQLNGKASTAQTFDWNPFFNGSIPNGDYRIIINCSFGGTITEITTRSVSGTGTLTGKINTTALGGTANSVSSSEQSQSHASSNTFAAGDDIVITMSSVSSLLDMSVKIKYTRTLA